jgi:hypothetical protein
VREAGGLVGPLVDGADLLSSGSLVAANANVYETLTKTLRAA